MKPLSAKRGQYQVTLSTNDPLTCFSVQKDHFGLISDLMALLLVLLLYSVLSPLVIRWSPVYHLVILNSLLVPVLILQYLLVKLVASKILGVKFSIMYNHSDKILRVFRDEINLSGLEEIYLGHVVDLEFPDRVVELTSREYDFLRMHWLQIAEEIAGITDFERLELPSMETTRYAPRVRAEGKNLQVRIIPDGARAGYLRVSSLVRIELLLIGVGVLLFLVSDMLPVDSSLVVALEYLLLSRLPRNEVHCRELVLTKDEISFVLNDFVRRRIPLSEVRLLELSKLTSDSETSFKEVVILSCLLSTGEKEYMYLFNGWIWDPETEVDKYYGHVKARLSQLFEVEQAGDSL